MSNEYKSFYKQVNGNEGSKCNYSTRLDTYGCGCQHDCSYCYAKSLLSFRGLWDNLNPSVADIEKIRKKISKLPDGLPPIRLGGMTDCFQPIELDRRVTYETIKALNAKRQPYLIVTKSDIIAREEYLDIMDKELAHVQITITCFDDDLYQRLDYEKAPLPSRRIAAVEKLEACGFDVSVRLSPFIPEFVDYDRLAAIKCNKLLVEFLRVNTWVQKWFSIDYSHYIIKQNGYRHLPLSIKRAYLERIRGFKEITVCEDEDSAYSFWKHHFNPNPADCCNLRGSSREDNSAIVTEREQMSIYDLESGGIL